MRRLLFVLISFVFFIMVSFAARANNIQVSAVSLTGADTSVGTIKVQFDLSWENSWRTEPPYNYDAAWVFIKYSVNSGSWSHATLETSGTNPAGFSTGTGTGVEIVVPSDLTGCFIQRAASGGPGTVSASSIQLVWNYNGDGVSGSSVDVKVFAVEMVYIPQGSFYIGDGTAATGGTNSHFYDAENPPNAVLITSTQPYIDSSTTSSTAGDIRWVNEGTAGTLPASRTQLNANYPTGYNAFYMMKYEISQGQYRDFLNCLTQAQQDARTFDTLNVEDASGHYVMIEQDITAVSSRQGIKAGANPLDGEAYTFGCDYNANGAFDETGDGEWIACNYINWADVIAYADWAGLRPMTELEFEKAARGSGQPCVLEEYAWGDNPPTIADSAYTLEYTGQANEGIAANYSTTAGNCSYVTTDGSINGPVRVGIFAAHASNSGRVSSGASYYGVMELSGNLYERPVTVGNADGRAFTGTHGDGDLSTPNSDWPGDDAVGGGLRGGSWDSDEAFARVSYRRYAASTSTGRLNSSGGRCVRASP